jgi:hypothetical protein
MEDNMNTVESKLETVKALWKDGEILKANEMMDEISEMEMTDDEWDAFVAVAEILPEVE